MSYSFIEVMARDPNQSYISLLNNMRTVLYGKYSQKPQLSVCVEDYYYVDMANDSVLIRWM